MTRRTMATRQGTAQKSPQIHKIAAANCWSEKAWARVAACIPIPGIAGIPGMGSMTEYHECRVKIAIAIARTTISAIVMRTIASCQRRRTRLTRGGEVTRKWKKYRPDNKKTGSMIQSMDHPCSMMASKTLGEWAITMTALRTTAAVSGWASTRGARQRRRRYHQRRRRRRVATDSIHQKDRADPE